MITKPSLWGACTAFADFNRIPIHIGDVLQTEHFTHYKRRRQIYMYHVVIGPSDDPWVTPLAQIITGINTGGNIPLEAMLKNWLRVDIITDMQAQEIGFYDRTKVPRKTT